MHGSLPNVPSKKPSIVRRRSRGSLPRLHLLIFSSTVQGAVKRRAGTLSGPSFCKGVGCLKVGDDSHRLLIRKSV